MSNSLQPHGLYRPWNSPDQNTGVGSLSLLQRIFPTQGLNPGLLHCWQILFQLSHQGSPKLLDWVTYLFSRGSSGSRNQTRVSCIAGRFFTNWAIREACTSIKVNFIKGWHIYTMEYSSSMKRCWYMLHGWISKALSKVKEGRHKRLHIIWVHLYAISRIGKSIEAESRLVVSRDRRYVVIGSYCLMSRVLFCCWVFVFFFFE